jgi:integrase
VHKLYVKINDKFEELSAVALLPNLATIKRIPIKDAIQKYLINCTSQKCQKNQDIEAVFFVKLEIYLDSKNIHALDEIKLEHLEELQIEFLKFMKPISVKRRFSVYRAFLEKCIDWEYLSVNPMKKLKYRKCEPNHFKFWNKEQFDIVLKQCTGSWRDCMIFLWLSGARIAEAKNLTWADIDLDNKIIYLKCDKNRSVKREFPLDDELSKLLHSIPCTGLFVFTNAGKQMNGDNLYQYVKKRLKRLGLKNLTPYGIRHSFANRLSEAGVNAFHIQKLMGHADIKTTLNYQNPDKFQISESLKKIR